MRSYLFVLTLLSKYVESVGKGSLIVAPKVTMASSRVSLSELGRPKKRQGNEIMAEGGSDGFSSQFYNTTPTRTVAACVEEDLEHESHRFILDFSKIRCEIHK